MKVLYLVFGVLFCSGLYSSVNAQEYGLATGLRGGNGIYASLKKPVRDDISLEIVMGINSVKKVDYGAVGLLLQFHNNFWVDRLYWYYGGGVTIAIQKDTYVGLTFNGGIDYALDNLPINISFDYAPILRFNDGVKLDWKNYGFTLRYILQD